MAGKPQRKADSISSYSWYPQKMQLRFLRAAGCAHIWGYGEEPVADEILYGGAAGGGKTDALIAACFDRCMNFPNSRVGYFRRTFPELALPGGVIDRTLSLLPQKTDQGKEIYEYLKSEHKLIFANGSTWTFCHMANEDDKHKYQSSQFDMVVFDEGTHFTESQYKYVALSRVRKWRPDLIATPVVLIGSNPGSIGHQFIKSRFVDPAAPGEVFIGEDGRRRVYIPAKLTDNKKLMDADPDYIKRLDALPEADRAALKDGDWDAFTGQFFSEFKKSIHVIKPFPIPKHWKRSSGYDFGYGAAAVHLWFAVDPATNLAYCYREYATVREPEPGKFESYKATIPVQARDILAREQDADDPPLEFRAADPSIFANTQANVGESISETFDNNGVHFEKGDNRRVAGWQRVHAWLMPAKDEDGNFIEDEHGPVAPLRFFNTCRYTISTLSSLPHDPKNPEDLDTHAEDHAADSLRMWVMHRPEPVNLNPSRFTLKRKVNRNKHWSEIEDERNATTSFDEDSDGYLNPISPRRKR